MDGRMDGMDGMDGWKKKKQNKTRNAQANTHTRNLFTIVCEPKVAGGLLIVGMPVMLICWSPP